MKRLVLVSLLLCLAGCASMSLPQPIQDISRQRQQRQEETVRIFEEKRDAAQYAAALAAWERGDADDCLAFLSELLRRRPEHREARRLLADLYLERGDGEQAEAELRRLLAGGDDAQAHHSLGLVLESAGRLDEACEHLRLAARLEPENPLFASSLAAISPASVAPAAYVTDGNLGSAAHHAKGAYRDLTVAARGDAARRLLRHANDALRGNQLPQAVDAVIQAMRCEPENPQIPLSAATELLRRGQPEPALTILRAGLHHHPSCAELHRASGAAHLFRGDSFAAQAALQQALSLDNGSALTYFLLGCSLAEQGKQEEAENCLAHAHRLDPRFPAADAKLR